MPRPKVRPDTADPWIEFRGFTLATQLPEGQMIEAHIALEDACNELEQAKEELSALPVFTAALDATKHIAEALKRLGCSD